MAEILPLLQDGTCTITGTCQSRPHEVWEKCPQVFKCGTCKAWSPREENRYGRNSGQCMLDRDARVYLDCNAQICPYYRPRDESPAYAEWKSRPRQEAKKARRAGGGRKGLDREAPPPTPAALAASAFSEHPTEVADAGMPVLEAELESAGPMPVLLERFRGGSARLEAGGQAREVPAEALFARLALMRRAIARLGDALDESNLTDAEKAKVGKDLGGIGGSMTTFNFLFRDKSDYFKGQGKG
jgi:hypothetical protein